MIAKRLTCLLLFSLSACSTTEEQVIDLLEQIRTAASLQTSGQSRLTRSASAAIASIRKGVVAVELG